MLQEPALRELLEAIGGMPETTTQSSTRTELDILADLLAALPAGNHPVSSSEESEESAEERESAESTESEQDAAEGNGEAEEAVADVADIIETEIAEDDSAEVDSVSSEKESFAVSSEEVLVADVIETEIAEDDSAEVDSVSSEEESSSVSSEEDSVEESGIDSSELCPRSAE